MSDEPNVDSDGLALAAMQAVEACGTGNVESGRVLTVRRPDGASTPEADFVCRDDDQPARAMVRRYAVETCGEEYEIQASVSYEESGAVMSIGFRCGKHIR